MTADQPPAKAILSEHLYKLAIEDVKVHNLDMRFRAIERLLAHDLALRARVAELEGLLRRWDYGANNVLDRRVALFNDTIAALEDTPRG